MKAKTNVAPLLLFLFHKEMVILSNKKEAQKKGPKTKQRGYNLFP